MLKLTKRENYKSLYDMLVAVFSDRDTKGITGLFTDQGITWDDVNHEMWSEYGQSHTEAQTVEYAYRCYTESITNKADYFEYQVLFDKSGKKIDTIAFVVKWK